jgi:hypothetical protein
MAGEKDELIHEAENDDISQAIRAHMEEEDKKNVAAPGGEEGETEEEKEAREKLELEEKENKGGEGETEEEKEAREKAEKEEKEIKDKGEKGKEPDPPETESPSLEDLNKVFESDYKSLDDLKEALNQSKEIDTLRKSSKEWEDKYTEKDKLLKEHSNPLTYFKDENEYKRQQLLKQHPELNSQLAGEVFSQDVDKMDSIKAITLKTMLENPGLEDGEQGILDLIYDKYGIDPETPKSEWDALTRNKINIESNQAKKFLKEIQGEIKLPETIDFEANKEAVEKAATEAKEKLTKDWKPFVGKMFDKFDKLELTREDKDGKAEKFFEYAVDKGFKKEAEEEALKLIVESGLEVNEKNLKTIVQDLQDQYFLINRNKIMQAHADEQVAAKDKEWREKSDNPKPPSDKEKPDEKKTGNEAKNEEVDTNVLKSLGDY